MSALPPKADIPVGDQHVCFVSCRRTTVSRHSDSFDSYAPAEIRAGQVADIPDS
jgi:hypothetical protein